MKPQQTLLERGESTGAARRGNDGFTLLELIIYLLMFALLWTPLLASFLTATRVSAEQHSINKISERNRVALNRVEEDFRKAISATVAVTGGGTVVTFTLPAYLQGLTLVNGDTIAYGLRPDPSPTREAGVGELVRWNQTTGNVYTVCSGLDLTQSSFNWDGTKLDISIANYDRLRTQDTVENAQTLSLYPRN